MFEQSASHFDDRIAPRFDDIYEHFPDADTIGAHTGPACRDRVGPSNVRYRNGTHRTTTGNPRVRGP